MKRNLKIIDEKKKLRHQNNKESIQELMMEGQIKANVIFDEDKDLRIIVPEVDLSIRNIFESGFANYIKGDWNQCKIDLKKFLGIKQNDGPSNTLLNVIQKHDYIAPISWPGYRELTEK